MHKRRQVAEEVAAKLFEAENAINQAMTAAAQLVALMPQACTRAGCRLTPLSLPTTCNVQN